MSISGKLFIDIIKANDLPSMDVGFGGASDPYIVVKVGGKQVIRTKSVNNNNNPVWNEKFQPDIEAAEGATVDFEVWDEDSYQKDDIIGKVSIPLNTVKSTKKVAGGEEVIQAPLVGKASSTLTFSISIRKFGAELSEERPGVKRAVQIAINYLDLPEGKGRLKGCYTDIETMHGVLISNFGFQPENFKILRDDDPNQMPTRANIIEAINWLTHDAKKGDSLFLQYSGHGGQVEDKDGDEEDKKDETLIPCDFRSAGQITDDELFAHLVTPLSPGVFMTVIMDCCHSGTGMDLPYIHKIQTSKVNLSEGGNSQFEQKEHVNNSSVNSASSDANVVMFSGCLDHQTSADAQIQGQFSGAMTYSIKTALEHNNYDVNYHKLLVDMHQILTDGKYSQIPQLSTARPFDLHSKFAI